MEIQKLNQEVESKKVESDRIGEGARELDVTVQRFKDQIANLEQDKLKLTGDLALHVELLKTTSENRAKMEQSLQDKTLLVTKRETAVKTVTQELVKANDTIKKLQDENANKTTKSNCLTRL